MASSCRFVAILMGSDSDLPTMQDTADVLAQFGIRYELNIKSGPPPTAHWWRHRPILRMLSAVAARYLSRPPDLQPISPVS